VAFSPDSKLLAVARLEGTLAVYETQTGKPQPAAKPAKPELTTISPRGVQRGQASVVKLSGKHLLGTSEVKFNHAKLAAKIVSDPPGGAEQATIEVAPADDLPRGTYDLSIVTPGGQSAAVKLVVDDLAQVTESEPNNSLPRANTASLPVSYWGEIGTPGDLDFYAFEAQAGETLVFDVAASSLGSKLNAVLTLLDARGRVLATRNDFDGQSDSLLAYTFAKPGRYSVRIGDLMLAGSAEHYYRLSIGAFPYVTAVFPLSVPANRESDVQLIGYNLPAGAKETVKAGASGEIALPLDAHGFRSRRDFKVLVGALPELVEAEPNDTPQQATPLDAPATVNGRIQSASVAAGGPPVASDAIDIDLYRFRAKTGQTWIVETDAARRGSPIDTRIEVLDSTGKPVERLWLQAVRDSYVTFRGIDSGTVDVRVKNWEEMELNELLFMQGEVCKIFRMPQGPDSGFNFYGQGAKRRCYFDTSPTTHALDEPCYIVEPHPPGTQLVPNGLPVFPLYYANDDDGERKLGADSRLTFTAPADGEYLVRVSDTRDQSGDRYVYRLSVREPRPDFIVTLRGANPTINAGSGKGITLSADRIDGFDGDINIEITGLPPGFSVSSPVVIQAGHLAAQAVVYAAADAPQPTEANWSHTKVTATAVINGSPVSKTVNNLGRIKLAEKPNLLVRLEPAELVIRPGTIITATLKVERNGFEDRIQFAVDNLPHGVIVDNIGLNGVLIPEGQSERQIFLQAAKWVPETSRMFHAVATNAGNQASPPVLLHVRASKESVAGRSKSTEARN
jgi:hypothetical protein